MEQVFERMVDRTRARLDVPRLRTMFGAKQRPRLTRDELRSHGWRSCSRHLSMA
jgi:hypothetical protein